MTSADSLLGQGSIPPEIHLEILKNCDIEAVKNFSKASKVCRCIALYILFPHLEINYATMGFLQSHSTVRNNLRSLALNLAREYSEDVVAQLQLMLGELTILRETSIYGVDTKDEFKMLSATLKSIKGHNITKLTLSVGCYYVPWRRTCEKYCVYGTEGDAWSPLDDYGLEFPSGLKILSLAVGFSTCRHLDTIGMIRSAYIASKDTIVEMELYLTVYERDNYEAGGRHYRRTTHPVERFLQGGVDLTSPTLKRLSFCCCPDPRLRLVDVSQTILPVKDIACLWPNLEVLEYCTPNLNSNGGTVVSFLDSDLEAHSTS
ncbi:hypothetical protein ABW21_db0208309 [Orbilia brochopaga]|nr:hypothetical protein ABW21_db0208309 [Drechslerella brochopaga]